MQGLNVHWLKNIAIGDYNLIVALIVKLQYISLSIYSAKIFTYHFKKNYHHLCTHPQLVRRLKFIVNFMSFMFSIVYPFT